MLTALNAGAASSARRARRFATDVVAYATPLARRALPEDTARPAAMRVCHVMTADLWAGAEVQVATALSYLSRRPDLQLSAVLFNEGRLARELRMLGIEVVVLDEQKLNGLDILVRLTRFLRQHPVDIVHTHRYKDTILGALAAKWTGVRHVVRTMHGLSEPLAGWTRAKFQAYEVLDKLTLWCAADRIIAVSRRMADTLKTSGYKPASVTYIHNGVALSQLRPTRSREEVRRELGITPRTILIGTAGRLSPVKAHDCLLRAAKLILREERHAKFLIVGDGPLRGELIALAEQLGVRHECLFPGARADVYDLIAAMDVFVLPSLAEGIPMALLEAMALGRPVVATAVGGVPEIVTHRSNGLLIDPGDEAALATACLDLAVDRTRAQAIGGCARETIEEAFSHETNGRAVVETYREIVSAPATRAAGRPYNLDTLTLCRELARGFLAYGWRRISYPIAAAAERRRMNRIRRNPARLTAALRSAQRILFVCHGNIIRSPFAARLVAQAVATRARVSISSAGLEAVSGKPPHPTALQIATALSVDLRQPRRVTAIRGDRGRQRRHLRDGGRSPDHDAQAFSGGSREDVFPDLSGGRHAAGGPGSVCGGRNRVSQPATTISLAPSTLSSMHFPTHHCNEGICQICDRPHRLCVMPQRRLAEEYRGRRGVSSRPQHSHA